VIPEIIRNHQKSPEIIRNHQKSSEISFGSMLSIPAFHTPCPFAMNASRWTVLGRRCLPRWTRGAALCLGAAVAAPLVPWRRNTTTAWCQGERSLFPEIEARKSGRLETKDGSCSLYYEAGLKCLA
jgi:hypothetical protein